MTTYLDEPLELTVRVTAPNGVTRQFERGMNQPEQLGEGCQAEDPIDVTDILSSD